MNPGKSDVESETRLSAATFKSSLGVIELCTGFVSGAIEAQRVEICSCLEAWINVTLWNMKQGVAGKKSKLI